MCFLCEKLKEYQLTLLAIILALGLIIAVAVGTKTMSQKGIYMTGSAEEIVTSDSAVWTFIINVKNPTLAGSYQTLQKQLPVLKAYLAENGINEENITIEPANYWSSYKRYPNGNTSDEIAYYNYSQNVKVKSNDVKKIQTLSTDIQKFAQQGYDINSQTPDYQYSKLADLKIKLLEKASQDAKNRANSTLKINGNKTGRILSVKTGVFQITSPESTDVSDSGIIDTSSIEKKVTAVVNVTYEIK
ncbi:MAG: SIMPL domain-containing protein [Candidatus Gastranaerophilales bacterium]|nr:SIMPL domain-containing protein [Candidatus Gastranaerophilales bacterium]